MRRRRADGLFDRIATFGALYAAASRAAAGKRRVPVPAAFLANLETEVLGLERGLVEQPIEYAMLRAGGAEVCGVMQITPEMGEFPPFCTVYFGVADVNAALEQAQSLGASVYVPPTDIIPYEDQPPIGRFAALADPQGAAFSVMQDLPQP